MQTSRDWDGLRNHRVVVPDHVVFRSFAQETVLLDIKSGRYHGLDHVGGRFFEVLTAAPHVEHASEKLAAEYEQPIDRITRDIVSFCNTLEERGLIDLRLERR